MPGPEATLAVDGVPVVLLGTIAGFVPDEERVRAAFARVQPGAVALGIPPEDLEGLEVLRTATEPIELPEPDPLAARFLVLLSRFGEVRIPPPDLAAAHALAKEAGLPEHALDLDDAAHTQAYTKRVKLRHVVRNNLLHKGLVKKPFSDVSDPYALAQAWDRELQRTGPIADLEAERALFMASRLREAATATKPSGRPLLAIVPAGLFASVRQALI